MVVWGHRGSRKIQKNILDLHNIDSESKYFPQMATPVPYIFPLRKT